MNLGGAKYMSGIRPTGNIHLGNYLGAIKQWKQVGGIWFVADLHQINNPNDVQKAKDQLEDCGLENIQIESDYKEAILSIAHELSFKIPVGLLKRMTQYKQKSQNEQATHALFSYPILMAADIFHFGGTHIPVGHDQLQHIEFANFAAKVSGRNPVTPVLSEAPRIMSLKDANKKMSKSDPDDYSRINLTDRADIIRDKIMKAKSSSSMEIETPELNNLVSIYKVCSGEIPSIAMRVKDFKEELASLINKELGK